MKANETSTKTNEGPAKSPGFVAVLRNRNFSLIWAGKAISNLGDQLRHIALIWLVKDLTGSALAMGTVSACALVPYLVFGMFGGALVDMVDRKKVMIISDVARAVLTLAVPALLLTGHLQFWHICVAALVLSSISAFFNPAMMATLPNLVPGEQLLAANSLNSLTSQATMIAGPALGGVIVGLAGSAPALFLDSISFVASAACVFLAKVPANPAAASAKVDAKSVLGGVSEGLRFIFDYKLLLAIVLVALGLNFVGAPTEILMAIHVDKAWGAGAAGFGAINSAWAAGALLGTLSVGLVVSRIKREDVISGGIFFQGLVMVGLVFGTSLLHGIAVFAVMGVLNSLVNVPTVTWAQQIIPDRVRGRVFSAIEVGCQAAVPLALALAGTAADAFGTVRLFAILAAATAAGGLVLKWVFVRYRGDAPAGIDAVLGSGTEPAAAGKA